MLFCFSCSRQDTTDLLADHQQQKLSCHSLALARGLPRMYISEHSILLIISNYKEKASMVIQDSRYRYASSLTK